MQWEEIEEESMAPLQTAEAAAKRGGEFVVECGAGGWRERDCRIEECQAFFSHKKWLGFFKSS